MTVRRRSLGPADERLPCPKPLREFLDFDRHGLSQHGTVSADPVQPRMPSGGGVTRFGYPYRRRAGAGRRQEVRGDRPTLAHGTLRLRGGGVA